MKLITYAIAPLFFVAINHAIAGTWECPEKTSSGDSVYTILFDSPEKDTNVITMRHINIKTNRYAFGGLNLDRLFVTTGVHKTLVEENAGKVWVVDGLGVSGVEAFPYAG